jgi:internalin A
MRKNESGLEIALKLIDKESREKTGTLDIGRLGLTEIPAQVYTLTHLRVLNLGISYWNEAGEVTSSKNDRLSKLTEHVITQPNEREGRETSKYFIQLLPDIKHLENLISLSTYQARVKALPIEISSIKGLRFIAMRCDEFSDLSPLKNAIRLEKLVCEGCKVSDLTLLSNLTSLKYVHCTRTLVCNLAPLQNLTALHTLFCEHTQVSDLTPLQNLTELQRLYCSHTQVSDLAPLQNLTALQTLECSETQVSDLTPLQNLTALQRLECSETQVSDLTPLQNLTALKSLDCAHTKVSDISPLQNLSELRELWIRDCPNLKIPKETIETGNAKKILEYFLRIAGKGAAAPLNEFKLILVGRGLAGKTTLIHKLTTGKFKKFKRTPGVNITPWPLKIGNDEVRAHTWDFGGQEIMHGTHRFFMTERSLYIAVFTGREGTEDMDADYWLSMIRAFGGNNVPIIVLLHKWDEYDIELNKEGLREKYGRGIIFLETDSKTGHGIEELKKQICKLAAKLQGLKDKWPVEWRSVKDKLPDQNQDWLTYENYRKFCSQNGVLTEKDQDELADNLNVLGLMLSYRDDPALCHFGVLHPEWVTQGIYKILNYRPLKEGRGQFSMECFAKILPKGKYPEKLYPFLLALMRKFRLCYQLDDAGENFIIPELLTKEEPQNLDEEFPPSKCSGLIYNYDSLLPEGLLPRFIVDTYVHQDGDHIWKPWRSGVVLKHGRCHAMVRGEISSRRIEIRVKGPEVERRPFIGTIREYLDEIHREYEKLTFSIDVIVPAPVRAAVKHDSLLRYVRNQIDKINVEIGEDVRQYNVLELLHSVDSTRILPPGGFALYATDKERLRGGLNVFISYSHKDARFKDELLGALKTHERNGSLRVWADERIEMGDDWPVKISDNLKNADIVVFLLSNNFYSSTYCTDLELKSALQRRARGECEVAPVVVRATNYQNDKDLKDVQVFSYRGRAIEESKTRSTAWLEFTKELDRVIARINETRGRAKIIKASQEIPALKTRKLSAFTLP